MADEGMLGVNILLMCLLINYHIGSNNAANSWGSSYCTRSLSITKAVMLSVMLAFLRIHF